MDFIYMNFLTNLNIFVPPKSILVVLLRSFMDMPRVVKNLSTFPAEVEQGDYLPSHFSSHMVNK